MKLDVPENEAWRRRRADERDAEPTEPWYMRQARAGVAAGGTVPSRSRIGVRPVVSTAPADDVAPPAPPLAAPASTVAPPPSAVTAASPTVGRAARSGAVIAALLFAVAAGWQMRDLIDPPRPAPASSTVSPTTVPAAAPVASAAARCDDPAVADRLRAQLAANVGAEGGETGWIARIAATPLTIAPPRVTVVGDDGSRFCGTTLTITPPGGATPLVAAVTYTVGAAGGAPDDVTALQGSVSLVRELVERGRPPRAAEANAAPRAAEPTPVDDAAVKSAPVKPRAKKPAESKPVTERRRAPQAESSSRTRRAPASQANPASTAPVPAVATAPPVPARAPVSSACDDAVSRAEAIVCATPALSRLDRDLGATLDRVAAGDAKVAAKIAGGQRRFLARRDRCTTEACIAERYTDRLDDIAKTEARARRNAERVKALPPCRGFEVYRPVRPCRVGG